MSDEWEQAEKTTICWVEQEGENSFIHLPCISPPPPTLLLLTQRQVPLLRQQGKPINTINDIIEISVWVTKLSEIKFWVVIPGYSANMQVFLVLNCYDSKLVFPDFFFADPIFLLKSPIKADHDSI